MALSKSIFIILIVTCFCLSLSQDLYAKTSPGLELTLVFEEDEYKASESISIDFQLKNTGKEPIYINKRLFVNSKKSKPEQREIYLEVTGPGGEKLPGQDRVFETGFPKTDYFVLLAPGEEVALERKKSLKSYFNIKEPGEYTIKAIYQNVYGKELGLDVFKDKVTSESVTIKIVE